MYLSLKGPRWAVTLMEQLTDFFFPWGTYCICCGNFIDRQRSYCICDHCIRHISWGNVEVPPQSLKQNHFTGPEAERLQEEGGIPVDSIRACMKYGLYERRIIFELKYNRHTYVARIMGKILADRILYDPGAEALLEADFIIPVPMHRAKERQRGFNQVSKTARYLGACLGIPVLRDGLVRQAETAAQRSVEGRDRLANLAGAFGAAPADRRTQKSLTEQVQGKRVILLDDIFTTGATVLHCSRVLKDAGAERVDVLVLATGNDYAEGFFEKEFLAKSGEIM